MASSCSIVEVISTGYYTIPRQIAEMYDDVSSERIEVTRYCCTGLACGESVAEVAFWALTQVYIWLHLNKALFVDWSPRTARSFDWATYIQI